MPHTHPTAPLPESPPVQEMSTPLPESSLDEEQPILPFSVKAELERWIDPNSADGSGAQKYFSQIAEKLLPDLSLPITFVVADTPEVNAGFTTAMLHDQEIPIVVIHKGLLEFITSEDELAFVMAHELSHAQLFQRLGAHNNSLGEEVGSDTRALGLMQAAGYAPSEGLQLLRRCSDPGQETLLDLFDIHGSSSNRILAAETALTHLERSLGSSVVHTTTPCNLLHHLPGIHHQSYIAGVQERTNYEHASLLEKLTILRDAVPHLDNNTRTSEWKALLSELPTEEYTAIHQEAFHQLADTVLDAPPTTDDWDSPPYLQCLLAANKAIYGIDGNNESLMPIGRLQEVVAQIQLLWQTEAVGEAASIARALDRSLEQFTSKFSSSLRIPGNSPVFGNYIGDLCSIPELTLNPEDVHSGVAPWEHLTLLASRDPSGIIASVMIKTGMLDFRSLDHLSFDQTRDLLESYPETLFRRPPAVQIPVPGRSSNLTIPDGSGGWTTQYSPCSDDVRFMGTSGLYDFKRSYLSERQGNTSATLDTIFHTLRDRKHSQQERHKAADSITLLLEQCDTSDPSQHEKIEAVLAEAGRSTSGKPYDAIRAYITSNPASIFTKKQQLDLYIRFANPAGSIASEFHADEYFNRLGSFNSVYLQDCRSLLGYEEPKTVEALCYAIRALATHYPEDIPEQECDEEADLFVDLRDLSPTQAMQVTIATLQKCEILLFFQKHADGDFHPELLTFLRSSAHSQDVLGSSWINLINQEISPSYLNQLSEIETCEQFYLLSQNCWFPSDGTLHSRMLCASETAALAHLRATGDDELVRTMLSSSHTAPSTAHRLIHSWATHTAAVLGIDDGSEQYATKIASLSASLNKSDISNLHINRMSNQLAEAIQSQLTTTMLLLHQPEISEKLLGDVHQKGFLTQAAFALLGGHPTLNEQFITYLSSPHNPRYERSIISEMRHLIEKDRYDVIPGSVRRSLTSSLNLNLMHQTFCDLPLEAQSVTMYRLLRNTGASSIDTVDFVLNRVFSQREESADQNLSVLLAQSYLSSCPVHQRGLLLSALLTSKAHHGEGVRYGKLLTDIGTGLQDPAWTRLLQGIHSSPYISTQMREDLGGIKESANLPTRGEVIELYDEAVDAETKQQISHLGSVLGAGTYWIYLEASLADGRDCVVGLLRKNVIARAEQGFSRLTAALEAFGSATRDVQVIATPQQGLQQKVVNVASEALSHASRMMYPETDTFIGQQQVHQAKQVYERYNRTKTVGVEHRLFIHTAESISYGEHFKIMERASGVSFNRLRSSNADPTLVQSVALQYAAIELSEIISGRPIDHDRHGGQIFIDKKKESIYVLDTGARCLTAPQPSELKARGRVLFHVFNNLMQQGNSGMSEAVVRSTSHESPRPHDRSSIEISRALLALNDFLAAIPRERLGSLAMNVLATSRPSLSVLQGFASECIKELPLRAWARAFWREY